MSRPQSYLAANNFVSQLLKLGISAMAINVENNEWLARVQTKLGNFDVYTNAKGRVTIKPGFSSDSKNKEKLDKVLEQVHAMTTIVPLGDQTWVAYTDGSAQHGQCGWSMVLFDPTGKKDYEKVGNLGPQSNGQIAGEVEGAICVIKDAVDKKLGKVVLRHDYEGVGKWGMGVWSNKDPDATRLKNWVQFGKERGINIGFEWTKGHHGDVGNERADFLASKATKMKASPRIEDPCRKAKLKQLFQANLGLIEMP